MANPVFTPGVYYAEVTSAHPHDHTKTMRWQYGSPDKRVRVKIHAPHTEAQMHAHIRELMDMWGDDMWEVFYGADGHIHNIKIGAIQRAPGAASKVK